MYMGRFRLSRRVSPANPARGLRVRTRRCITHEPPRRVPNRIGGSFDSRLPRPKAREATGRGDLRKPRLTGEGDFVSTRNPSKPSEKRKRRKSAFTEISPAAVAPPRCFGTPTPEAKARPLAVLRAVLAESAPEFQARIDAGEQGGQP